VKSYLPIDFLICYYLMDSSAPSVPLNITGKGLENLPRELLLLVNGSILGLPLFEFSDSNVKGIDFLAII